MIKPLFILSLSTLSLLGGFTAEAKEPKNLDLIKQELIEYHDSGHYLQDQRAAISKAKQYLMAHLAANKNGKPLAIIFDIDDTALSNYPKLLKRDFSSTETEINKSYNDPSSPAIQPTLELYQFAKAHQVDVFFITGRPEAYRQPTEQNLKLMGYKNWNALIMRRDKAEARNEIEKKGYDIVLNMSDQARDLKGGHADRMIKMPNPYYQ
jgi:predicted secreted acid phosphatase